MVYKILRKITWPLIMILLRPKVVGKKPLNATGPVIVVANHVTAMDPLLLIALFNRKLHFMSKKELFKCPIIAWFFKAMGMIPVDRQNVDLAAIKSAKAYLDRGEAVGIFPEGTRSKTGRMGEFLRGSAFLAYKSEAAVLPVYILPKTRGAVIGDLKQFDSALKDMPKNEAIESINTFMRVEIDALRLKYEAQKSKAR